MAITEHDYNNMLKTAKADTRQAKAFGRESIEQALWVLAKRVSQPNETDASAFARALRTDEGMALYEAYSVAPNYKSKQPRAEDKELSKSINEQRLEELTTTIQKRDGVDRHEAMSKAMDQRPDLADF